MGNKEIVSTSKITKSLIIQKILWEIPFSLLHSLAIGIIGVMTLPAILEFLLLVLLQIAIAYITWKFSISASFAKETVASKEDISTIMRNLIIFTIIECIVFAIAYKLEAIIVIIVYFAILPLVKKEITKQID